MYGQTMDVWQKWYMCWQAEEREGSAVIGNTGAPSAWSRLGNGCGRSPRCVECEWEVCVSCSEMRCDAMRGAGRCRCEER